MSDEYAINDRVNVRNWDGKTATIFGGTVVQMDLPTDEGGDTLFTVRAEDGQESLRWGRELAPADPCPGCGASFEHGQAFKFRIPVSDRWPVGFWHDGCWDAKGVRS